MITPRSTRIVMAGLIACVLIIMYRWSNAVPCESGASCPGITAAPPCPRCKRYVSDRPIVTSAEEKEKLCKKRVGSTEISNQNSWSDISQEGEMTFWVEPSRWTAMVSLEHKAGFKQHYAKYFNQNGGFDVTKDFRGLTVVDVGAGPRPLAAVFEDTTLYVIEPLGDRFLKLAKEKIDPATGEYLEIQKARKVFGRPAETFVPELEGKVDVALSTNSLDHTWDPTKYLENMRRYLKPDGYVYLIVDLHIKTEPMHPQKSLLPSILDQAHAAGLRFERGECILPAAYPGFAFNSCWMILKKAVKNVDLYEGCEARS